MPDWSYQTLFRPVLFQLSPATGRDLALGALGRLSRFLFGPMLIDFLGHMRPDGRLRHTVAGIEFPARVGLGSCLDPQLLAPRALSRIGTGFLEVGPVTMQSIAAAGIDRDAAAEMLIFHSPNENPGLEAVAERLSGVENVPILVRLANRSRDARFEQEATTIIDRLGPGVAGFIIEIADPAGGVDAVKRLAQRAQHHGRRTILQAVPITASEAVLKSVVQQTAARDIDGVFLDGRRCDASGRCSMGKPLFEETRQASRRLRESLPSGAVIIATGGVHEPAQALQLIDAGCDLVCVDTGLVFSGPGLCKRINEAVLYRTSAGIRDSMADESLRPGRASWFWTGLMGAGMLVGGAMALIIASTRVVMPYDEASVGLTRDQIASINDHLLHFMQHDRVTLAGTMLSIGILYVALSVYGSRRGMHWAHVAMLASACSGFASFFLFLGFGYFDPFHAFVTAVLLQPLLLAMHCDLPRERPLCPPELTNDRAWRWSQWGQLAFVIHGAVLVVAGCVIAWIGITTVFVPEDLEFMKTSAGHLTAAHPQLVPLVAHDRATFGGMLIACGVCVLLSSLWGFRRGQAWLWRALVTAGATAYLATIVVHWHVGYTSLKHLLPAFGGLGLLVVGGALSFEHMCGFRAKNFEFEARRAG
jgi:dihydroorotate dehydrogenase